jgi:murein DD-endopeptidase MepM/ murein hydrolase activator NlpD
LCSSGCPRARPPAWLGQAPDPEAVGVYHPVAAGQSLGAICKAYGADLQEVVEVNGIADPDKVQAGMLVFIPDAAKVLDPGTGKPNERPPGVETVGAKPVPGRILWPVEGVVTSRFGIRGGRRHDGIDIGAPVGTPIRAAADGTVLYVGEQGGYGKLVILQHPEQLITVYAHTHRNLVEESQRVRQGQVIAEVGQTGRATGPHLHFEVREATKPRNPMVFLPRPD